MVHILPPFYCGFAAIFLVYGNSLYYLYIIYILLVLIGFSDEWYDFRTIGTIFVLFYPKIGIQLVRKMYD